MVYIIFINIYIQPLPWPCIQVQGTVVEFMLQQDDAGFQYAQDEAKSGQ